MLILFSSKRNSQLLKKGDRIDQSNSSSSSIVARSTSEFNDQPQKEVVVDPTMIFGAENYKYSAIYAQSDDFNSKISKWKQRSSSIKGIDLKLLIGLTYIDHLQRVPSRSSSAVLLNESALRSALRAVRHVPRLHLQVSCLHAM